MKKIIYFVLVVVLILAVGLGVYFYVDAQKENDYTIFDIPYFHRVTIERIGLEKTVKLRYFPILTNPIKSIKYLFAKGKKVFQCDCGNWEIINFT